MISPTPIPGLALAAAAVVLVGCGSTQQRMNLSPESLLTPPHSMAAAEYPFDGYGNYIDAWAAQGALRYRARVDSDSHDHGRATRTTSASKRSTSSRPRSSSTPSKSGRKPPAAKPRSHTVKRGDTLSSLSRRYGVSIQAIKRANGMKSDLLIDGRRVVIPR
jgi:nucleoid-associated protein YgaU